MPQSLSKLFEFTLLGLLALLWGSSYLFIKIAVNEIPPLTLIATRVSIAALFLFIVMKLARQSLPCDLTTWKMLMIQAFLNSIGAWTVLAWGQQFVDAGMASVLNSTSPIFVFLITLLLTRHEPVNLKKLSGVLVGLTGVVILVGSEALERLGDQVLGQLACIAGAMMYACAAIYGRRLHSLSAVSAATGIMICAAVVLVPIALLTEQPWVLDPSSEAIKATLVLSIFCSGAALLLYFRLLRTIGSMGVASQAYLRAGIGVLLGVIFLGESLSMVMIIGLVAAIIGVALINWPTRK